MNSYEVIWRVCIITWAILFALGIAGMIGFLAVDALVHNG